MTAHDGGSSLVAARRLRRGLAAPQTLADLIRAPYAEDPAAEAVRFCHHSAEPESLTWEGIWHSACVQLARLQAAGIEPGDRVLILLPTGPEFISTFFGVVLAGGIPVPAAPPGSLNGAGFAAHAERIGNISADCQAAAAIALPAVLEALKARLTPANPRIALLTPGPAAGDAPAAAIAHEPCPTDLALLQYTSGSTSQPKGVELTHRNVLENTAAIVESVWHPGAVGLSWLPLHHDMGLIGTFLAALHGRIPVVLLPSRSFIADPARWLRCISEYRATITVAPNFAFAYCVENVDLNAVADISLDSLRIALNGAEPVDPAAVARFEEKFAPLGLRQGVVLPVYGLAENCLAVTFAEPGLFRIDEVDADRLEQDGRAVPATDGSRRRRFVSVGVPIGHQRVRIADGASRSLPERQVGEILVAGPSVMKGYHRQPRQTAQALRGGWLRTGDLGYLADGRLYVTGRRKDIIIRRGRNYYPQDLEHQVKDIQGIRSDSTVAFSGDGDGRAWIVVVAETRLRDPQARQEAAREIRRRIHDACLFGPDEVLLVRPGTIPRTTSGKVRRQECKRRYLAGELGESEPSASVRAAAGLEERH
jgi:acyl-CoA synthetase (AMP-forming)/AMP-acid ligase II